MKCGAVRFSQLQKYRRWDVGFHLLIAAHPEAVAKLKQIPESTLLAIAQALPRDRELYNQLNSGSVDRPVQLTTLGQVSLAVYVAAVVAKHGFEAHADAIRTAAAAELEAIRVAAEKYAEVMRGS